MTPERARLRFKELQARAQTAGLVLRPPPPEPTTCYGRGCNGCVWEGFLDAALFWEEDAVEALNAVMLSKK